MAEHNLTEHPFHTGYAPSPSSTSSSDSEYQGRRQVKRSRDRITPERPRSFERSPRRGSSTSTVDSYLASSSSSSSSSYTDTSSSDSSPRQCARRHRAYSRERSIRRDCNKRSTKHRAKKRKAHSSERSARRDSRERSPRHRAEKRRTLSCERSSVQKSFIDKHVTELLSKGFIVRWIKKTLKMSGINTDIFSAYSTRQASTSAAKRLGVNIDLIKSTGGWTEKSGTFAKFYDLPIASDINIFANAILNQKKKKKKTLPRSLSSSPFFEVMEAHFCIFDPTNRKLSKLFKIKEFFKIFLHPVLPFEVRKMPRIEISSDGTVIPFEDRVVNLGLVMSLSWDAHVRGISSRIHGVLHRLRAGAGFLPVNVKKMLVNAFIMPHFDYACLALIEISASLDIKLRRLLNACIRYIFQLPRDAALRPYYDRLDWLLPSQRRDYFLNIQTFKALNRLCPDYISSLYHWTGSEVRRSARIAGGAPTIEVFKVGHVNAQSLSEPFHFREVKSVMELHEPHIMAVSESWLKTHISSCDVDVPGYVLLRHDRISLGCGLSVPNYVETAIARRDFRQLDPLRFNAELGSIDWEHIARLPDVDDMVETLTARLNGLFDAHAPLRTIVQKKCGKPWFGAGLRAIIRERNRAWRRYRRLGRPDDLMEFKRLRNHLRVAARNAKAAHYRAKLSGCAPAQAWRILRSLSVSSRTQDSFMLPVDVDTLNEGFVRGGGHVAASALRPTVRVAPEERLYLTDVDASEVIAAFKRARSNARGADGLSLDQLWLCLPLMLPALCRIFGASFRAGVFPRLWKEALVRPLPKRHPPRDASHLRPISILCSLSKIFECVALKRMSDFVEERDFLDVFQSGFRRCHSTQTALTRIVDCVRESVERGEVTLMVAIDFSRAFDMVDVDLLLRKLCALDFSDAACAWLRSYLSGRPQRVVGTSGVSYPGPCSGRGGSRRVVSCRHSKHHLYADDFTIFSSGPASEAEAIISRINEDLARISAWAVDNGLSINVRKTQAAWIGSRGFIARMRSVPTSPLILDGEPINLRDNIKLLGVVLDETLSWRAQVTAAANRCFAALARLRHHRDCLPRETRLMLVRSLVFPHLDYGAELLADLSGELTTRMERCMNAALRFVTGVSRFDHITPSYVACGLLKYRRRRDYLALCLLASTLRRGGPAYLADRLSFVRRDAPGSLRRSHLELKIPWAATSCLQSAFFVHTARLWNDLPRDLQARYRNETFRTYLYDHMLG
ncbi:unnamed protein product [Trichogramma brassicae]|uniref:Reverse transcriptase domain-containing protein n=1 Tax=Trichogramma brassicae TaxID=86971 RepID=A0A6H5IP12_9HYME|nr:unnamed protein product [Trichogramma brassicae]